MTCPAKLNLYLDVLHRRDDGYHELVTVMQGVDLADVLTVRRLQGPPRVELRTSGRPCPTGDDNLVARAAELVFARVRRRVGLQVILEKKTPLGAGMGGGSADGASMLWSLNHLVCGGRLTVAELSALGAELGSDVPFFFRGGTAVASGRGEKIEPVVGDPGAQYSYVIVYPGVEVSTAAIYGGLNLGLTKRKSELGQGLDDFIRSLGASSAGGAPRFENALTKPLRSAHPELAVLQDRLTQIAETPFTVTGSGSAMFAAVSEEHDGHRIADALRAETGLEVFVCAGLPANAT